MAKICLEDVTFETGILNKIYDYSNRSCLQIRNMCSELILVNWTCSNANKL